jgi:hypothetical protein
MPQWVPFVSFLMGTLAFAIWHYGIRYYQEKVVRSYRRWREEVFVELAAYNDDMLRIAEREQRLMDLRLRVPEGYTSVIWRGVEMAQAIPPLMLRKSEELGFYEPGTFDATTHRPTMPTPGPEDPTVSSSPSPVRWIGKHRQAS